MNKELKQQAAESADRMSRAGMTLSARIMQELVAEVERLEKENAAQADHVQVLEQQIIHAQDRGKQDLQLQEHDCNALIPASAIND